MGFAIYIWNSFFPVSYLDTKTCWHSSRDKYMKLQKEGPQSGESLQAFKTRQARCEEWAPYVHMAFLDSSLVKCRWHFIHCHCLKWSDFCFMLHLFSRQCLLPNHVIVAVQHEMFLMKNTCPWKRLMQSWVVNCKNQMTVSPVMTMSTQMRIVYCQALSKLNIRATMHLHWSQEARQEKALLRPHGLLLLLQRNQMGTAVTEWDLKFGKHWTNCLNQRLHLIRMNSGAWHWSVPLQGCQKTAKSWWNYLYRKQCMISITRVSNLHWIEAVCINYLQFCWSPLPCDCTSGGAEIAC